MKKYLLLIISIIVLVFLILIFINMRPEEIEVDNTDILIDTYTEIYDVDESNTNMEVFVSIEGEYIKPTQPLKYYVSKYQYSTMTHSKIETLGINDVTGDVISVHDRGSYYEMVLGGVSEDSDAVSEESINDTEWVLGDYEYTFAYTLKPTRNNHLFANIEFINYHIMKRCNDLLIYNNSEYNLKLKTNKGKTILQSVSINEESYLELQKELIDDSNVRLFLNFEGLPEDRTIKEILLPTRASIALTVILLFLWLLLINLYRTKKLNGKNLPDISDILRKKKIFTQRDILAVIFNLKRKGLVDIIDIKIPEWINSSKKMVDSQHVFFKVKLVNIATNYKPKESVFEKYLLNLINKNNGEVKSQDIDFNKCIEDFNIMVKSTKKYKLPGIQAVIYYIVAIILILILGKLNIFYTLPLLIAVTARLMNINISYKYENLVITAVILLTLWYPKILFYVIARYWYIIGNKTTKTRVQKVRDRLTSVIYAFIYNDDNYMNSLEYDKENNFYLYLYYD